MFKLDKQAINEAWDLLQELKEMVKELDEMKKDMLNRDMNAIFDMIEKIADKSSEYYLKIPESGFNESALPPLDDISTIEEKLKQLAQLKDIEITAKIILGAQKSLIEKQVHPVEYCYNSLNTRVLPLDLQHPEFKLIKQYMKNADRRLQDHQVKNVFAVERRGEAERYIYNINIIEFIYLEINCIFFEKNWII